MGEKWKDTPVSGGTLKREPVGVEMNLMLKYTSGALMLIA